MNFFDISAKNISQATVAVPKIDNLGFNPIFKINKAKNLAEIHLNRPNPAALPSPSDTVHQG
jgi:hypothetical protein